MKILRYIFTLLVASLMGCKSTSHEEIKKRSHKEIIDELFSYPLKPLPKQLTKEQDDALVAEGILPPIGWTNTNTSSSEDDIELIIE